MKDETPDGAEFDAAILESALQARSLNWLGFIIVGSVFVWVPLALGWEHIVRAWRRLGFMKEGVFGLTIGLSVLAVPCAFFFLTLRRVRLRSTRSIICPNCLYTIAEEWHRPAESLIRCPECGFRFEMWAYMTAAAPPERGFAWAFALRRRWARLLLGVGGSGALSALIAGALMALQFPNETPINLAGLIFASAAVGMAVAIAVADHILMRMAARWAQSPTCPLGHPNFRRDIGYSRSLCWCDTCRDGWWIPTTRDGYLAAVTTELDRERQTNEATSPD